MGKSFIDTNVFFYSVDGRDPVKQAKATALLLGLAKSGEGRISTQIGMEFAVNLVKKLGHSPSDAGRLLKGLTDFTTVATNIDTVRRALDLMGIASLSFWDAAVIAAAEAAGCDTLFTEDLNAGQTIAGVKILNPF